jgi:hypothetical protein
MMMDEEEAMQLLPRSHTCSGSLVHCTCTECFLGLASASSKRRLGFNL